MRTVFAVTAALLLSGCLGMPQEVKPVENFKLNNYLGKWYEIARLDHRENYQYAFVSGSDTSYLWLLARAPEVSQKLKDNFTGRAQALGFQAENLIWFEH